jgi:hypothetical protein
MKTDKIVVDDKSNFKQKKSLKNFFLNLIQDNVNTMQILKFDEN